MAFLSYSLFTQLLWHLYNCWISRASTRGSVSITPNTLKRTKIVQNSLLLCYSLMLYFQMWSIIIFRSVQYIIINIHYDFKILHLLYIMILFLMRMSNMSLQILFIIAFIFDGIFIFNFIHLRLYFYLSFLLYYVIFTILSNNSFHFIFLIKKNSFQSCFSIRQGSKILHFEM